MCSVYYCVIHNSKSVARATVGPAATAQAEDTWPRAATATPLKLTELLALEAQWKSCRPHSVTAPPVEFNKPWPGHGFFLMISNESSFDSCHGVRWSGPGPPARPSECP